jgi:hypothetical protein
MLTNNYKRLYADNNYWLTGSCREGVVINELAFIARNDRAKLIIMNKNCEELG